MELGLGVGENSKPPEQGASHKGLTFFMGLSMGPHACEEEEDQEEEDDHEDENNLGFQRASPIQLDLLPHAPVPRNHVPRCSFHHNGNLEAGFSPEAVSREEVDEQGGLPPSTATSFLQMELFSAGGNLSLNEAAGEIERASSRASDEDEVNGTTRKKLRLSKEQSAFLEESFKEHYTLNPKQKLALAKQLNLRPRQVEVWFQNRRARTKLKQTEVDCEYLKRCFETLTEENRRLQKELVELRALKTTNSLFTQLPATTLSMCPSCERVAVAMSSATATTTGSTDGNTSARLFSSRYNKMFK